MACRTAMSRLVTNRSLSLAAAARTSFSINAQRFVSTSSKVNDQESTAVASTSTTTSSLPSATLPSPFEPALTLPRTHNHHVASLHLRAHGPGETLENLQIFCDFALRAGYALGIPMSKPASLPTRTSLWTVPKGPFVHKKSQENFQRRVHKRVIKVWDAEVEVVEKWLHFLRIHCMDGVGMRVEVYRHFPLSIGSTLLAASTSQLRAVPEEARESDNATLRASDPQSSQVMKLAKAIIDEEIAKQDAEDAAERQQIEDTAQGSNMKKEADQVALSEDENMEQSSSEEANISSSEGNVEQTRAEEAQVEEKTSEEVKVEEKTTEEVEVEAKRADGAKDS